MKISIFGLGYVGAVSLACLARDGHQVIGVDIDQTKLDLIKAGTTPVVEEGMVDLMASVAASGRVSVTTNVGQALLDSDISLICVGTPSASHEIRPGADQKDPKTRLQELLQGKRKPLPSYVVIKVKGEAHNQEFTVQCEIEGVDATVIGVGSSRRKAEQAAAEKALEQFK